MNGLPIWASLAVPHDGDLVGEGQGLALVVRDQDSGHAGVLQHFADRPPGGHPEAGVERGERLIQQHELRLAGQSAGQRDALLLAAGELMRAALGHGRVQGDHFQQFADPGLDPAVPAGELCRRPGRRRCSARRSGAGTGRRPAPRSRHGACAPGTQTPSPATLLPLSEMLPVSGCSKPAISRSSVVLPEPEGPTIAVVPPWATERLTPLRTAWDPKFLVTALISRWLFVLGATDARDPRLREPGRRITQWIIGHCPAAFLDCWKRR